VALAVFASKSNLCLKLREYSEIPIDPPALGSVINEDDLALANGVDQNPNLSN
jgi:hypothetical protein